MIEHVAVHENDSKARTTWNQGRSAFGALASFNTAEKQGCDVRIKRYANNELRVTFPQAQRLAKGQGSEAGAARCFESAEADLVYNAKVQLRGDLVLPPVRRARGRKPTRYAMHSVREACSIVEAKYGKDVQFLTLTLPGRTPAAIAKFAEFSTPIMGNFMQRHRTFLHKTNDRNASAHGNTDIEDVLQDDSCWVAEHHADGTLHYHVVVGMRDKVLVRIYRKLIKKWWRDILLDYSEKTGVDLFARRDGGTWKHDEKKPRTQCVKVRKSVSRYISKYVSKGAHENYQESWAPPAAWYHISQGLRERVAEERQFNAITFLTKDAAQEKAVELVEFAQKFGGKACEMRNPFTQAVCGYVVFFDNQDKDLVYMMWNDALESWRPMPEVLQGRGSPGESWCGCEYEYLREVDLIFDGKPLSGERSGCADLCAPFSAPEKGGGMRYHG